MKEKSSPIGCFRYGEDLSYCTFALEFNSVWTYSHRVAR